MKTITGKYCSKCKYSHFSNTTIYKEHAKYMKKSPARQFKVKSGKCK